MSPYSTKEICLCLNLTHSEKNIVTLQTFELDLSQTSCSPLNPHLSLEDMVTLHLLVAFLWLGGGRGWSTRMPCQDTRFSDNKKTCEMPWV